MTYYCEDCKDSLLEEGELDEEDVNLLGITSNPGLCENEIGHGDRDAYYEVS